MNNRDNFRTKRDDGDNLGRKDHKNKVSKNPAPKETKRDRESENTPPENEVYVNIEPDELHLGDDEIEEVDVREEK